MTNQVTSIEQSKRLLELGVPAEKASMVWCPMYRFDVETKQFIHIGEYDLCMKHKAYTVIKEDIIPAFTVADLLGVLPNHCRMLNGAWLNMEIVRWEDIWRLSYFQMASGSDEVLCGGAGREYYFLVQSTRLIDLLYGAVEWLLSNKCELKI